MADMLDDTRWLQRLDSFKCARQQFQSAGNRDTANALVQKIAGIYARLFAALELKMSAIADAGSAN